MQNNNIGLIVLTVVILIVAFYFFNKNQGQRVVADTAIQSIAPACVPFTKAQQDAEKRKKRADCANKLLIPFVGQVQYYACYKNVDANLTPVTNC